jgi:hypothetical protein
VLTKYVYVLVRTDISLTDQIVQVGHACLEAGFKFQKPSEIVNLVVVGIESEIHLLATLERMSLRGIQFVLFHEPDDQMGFTAACTKPLTVAYRREFRKFPVWKSAREVSKT